MVVAAADGRGGLDTREDGHVDVHEDQVDLVFGKLVEGRDTRVHDRGELDGISKVLAEEAREDGQVDGVVVDDHDLDFAGLLRDIAVDAGHAHGGRGRRAGGRDAVDGGGRRHVDSLVEILL